ncbi:pilus assembly protein [Aquabacterium sp.]|uniref:pilus assembly protein n=1 Tax=Aquabacterium sp. TaxID=1872578 RepID=UPI0035ADA892
MSNYSTRRRPSHLTRWGVTAAVLMGLQVQLLPYGWTATAPAQKPLITREGGQPNPNVMLTLDTSWSMIAPFLPEGAFTINGATVNFPGNVNPILHPKDTRYYNGNSKVGGDGGVFLSDPTNTTNVFQRQIRSPDVNKIYYNPEIRYQPWLASKTGQVEVRYNNAKPQKAWFDPDKTTDTPANYADLTASTTSTSALWCSQGPTVAGGSLNCSISSKNFNPAIYFRLKNSTADPNAAGSYIMYDINSMKQDSTSISSFQKYPNRTDCLGTTCTQAEERQNYANWFVYHRTRLHIVQSAIPESFLQLGNTIRTGWATIHAKTATSVDGQSNTIVLSGMRDLSDSRKTELVSWIRSYNSDKNTTDSDYTTKPALALGTPLRSALDAVGKYFQRTDGGSPWRTDPASKSATGEQLSCRRSYNLLITDGYYNDTGTSYAANEDGTNGSTITNGAGNRTYTYTAAAPYSDGTSNSLADVAMYYWKNDLQTGIANNVPYGNDTPDEDPAFWQHLVQFPIGLGIEGNIAPDSLDTAITQLTNGTRFWWGTSASTDAVTVNSVGGTDKRRIDDLLHAAVNTRGQYFSAKNSKELTDALTTALNRAADRSGLKEGGIAAASPTLTANNVKYIPEYTTTRWTGDIKAFTLNASGVAGSTPIWSANDKMPGAASRNIITWDGTSGVNFTWDTIGTANQDTITPTLPTGATGEQFVNYIRGDTTNEDTSQVLGLFRKRQGKLPDFINSNPVLIKGNTDLGYQNLPSGTPGQDTYAAFVTTKAARNPVLIVGGNGGMLHAFADYTATGVVRGQEVFAYVPRAVLGNLNILAQKDYGSSGNYHHFYVDGPLTEADAYYDTAGSTNDAWRNVLVGTLGAGGKGIFALNVTDPTSMGTSSILWEKTSADNSDMGYIFSAPQVGVLPNGSWVTIVGNGAYSTNGKAALLVIDMWTGSVSAVVADSPTAKDNGLGGVRLVKNANQQITAIYAGDLKGNVWRFDVTTSGTTSTISVGLNGEPLYTTKDSAGTIQPITAAPAVLTHPNGGNFVIVGTGKLFDEGDNDTTSTQSVYGLWDKATTTGDSVFKGLTTTRDTKLVKRTIASTTSSSYYNITGTDVDYSTDLGWYVDLTIASGQRSVYPPIIVRDFVLISTMVPAQAAALCENALGVGYNMLLPALSGEQYKSPVLDTDGDGDVDTNDMTAGIYKTNADGGDTILTKTVNGKTTVSLQNTTGQQPGQLPNYGKDISSRVWRQLMSPPHP